MTAKLSSAVTYCKGIVVVVVVFGAVAAIKTRAPMNELTPGVLLYKVVANGA